MREKKDAFWLVDAIASYYHEGGPIQRAADQFFRDLHFWRLTPDGNGGATLTSDADTGQPKVITQEIEFTDFKFDSDDPYVLFSGRDLTPDGKEVWVLHLPSEY